MHEESLCESTTKVGISHQGLAGDSFHDTCRAPKPHTIELNFDILGGKGKIGYWVFLPKRSNVIPVTPMRSFIMLLSS